MILQMLLESGERLGADMVLHALGINVSDGLRDTE